MSFSHRIDDIVQVVEAAGVAILVVGGLIVLVRSAVLFLIPRTRSQAYQYCRRHLGRTILLGLEVLIVADIIRTVIVDQTPTSVAVLATIVAIRIALSWSLAVEVDGAWPWNRRSLRPEDVGRGNDEA
ncbi:MAG: DUF1622 domain-containing protein [Acidimicrobiales bacterium]